MSDKGISNDHKDNVINAYYRLFESTTFSWGTDEFEKNKAFFIRLKAISKPGLHAKIIQDQIDYLDKQIKSLNRDDEEFYNPRG